MNKPISIHEEAFITHWVRLAAEVLHNRAGMFCNERDFKMSIEQQTFFMLGLISREPRPFVEYLESGCTHLRRAEIVGKGTKRSPYKAQWRDDYYRL